jgi:hypothetical protein
MMICSQCKLAICYASSSLDLVFSSGGTLGLFVGMSVMSGIEIVMWGGQLVYKLMKAKTSA